MNARRDPDRLIHTFLMEGQTELADQVYDAVRSSIERKRQRVVIGPWRTPFMNKLIPIGLGVAAVVVALVVGTRLLGPAPSGPGSLPSATPSATPAPSIATPSPKPSLASASAVAGLPLGSFHLWTAALPVSVSIQAPGWAGDAGKRISS